MKYQIMLTIEVEEREPLPRGAAYSPDAEDYYRIWEAAGEDNRNVGSLVKGCLEREGSGVAWDGMVEIISVGRLV